MLSEPDCYPSPHSSTDLENICIFEILGMHAVGAIYEYLRIKWIMVKQIVKIYSLTFFNIFLNGLCSSSVHFIDSTLQL